jgi:serine/threonine protein kinase
VKFCPVCGTEYADEIRFCQRDGQTLRASNPSGDLVGQVIADRYHISKKLGEGGMGAVYLAEHVKMGRQSAIKVMGTGMSHDPEAISRFNREAANASRINHPNVCAVYDFGETEDGTIYLAMEFVEGRTLSSLLKETGPLPLPRAVGLLKQCADGLQAAHDLGIVHRDLKPDNIMIVSPKGREVVKVVDFGIAKAGASEPGQNVTKTGLVVGTPEYMSPEQLSGDKVDGRSDIYSLALVFYRMITDTLPFVADTAQETMIKRLTDEPIPLAQARPDSTLSFPASLQKVMDRALARWPQDRFASATEFAADAARAIEGIKSTAMATSADTEAKTQVVRPADITSAKTAAIPATRVSTSKTPSKMSPVVVGVGVVVLALGGGGYVMRDTLFGSAGRDSTTQDSLGSITPGDTGIQNLSRETSDSTTSPADTSDRIQPNGNQNPPRDPGNQTRDTGRRVDPTPNNPPAPTAAELQRQVTAFIDDIEFTDDPAKRREASRLGESVWRDRQLPAKLRAEAAFIVGQALMEEARSDESKRPEAKTWIQRAVDLDRRPTWVSILQGL